MVRLAPSSMALTILGRFNRVSGRSREHANAVTRAYSAARAGAAPTTMIMYRSTPMGTSRYPCRTITSRNRGSSCRGRPRRPRDAA